MGFSTDTTLGVEYEEFDASKTIMWAGRAEVRGRPSGFQVTPHSNNLEIRNLWRPQLASQPLLTNGIGGNTETQKVWLLKIISNVACSSKSPEKSNRQGK